GYDSYYASDWAGPTWGVGWNSGYRSFGYPASYGYSADWDGSDVALETYVAPPVRTYAVASERYVYPRTLRYRSSRSYAYAPSRSRYIGTSSRSYSSSRLGYAGDRYRTSSF